MSQVAFNFFHFLFPENWLHFGILVKTSFTKISNPSSFARVYLNHEHLTSFRAFLGDYRMRIFISTNVFTVLHCDNCLSFTLHQEPSFVSHQKNAQIISGAHGLSVLTTTFYFVHILILLVTVGNQGNTPQEQ